ncbi:hypothetical protein K8R43_05570 [archaeon]|nr:hypothetical protein [archaeon]
MWLITTLIAAIIVTAAWFAAPKKYRLDLPALMLWGAGIMIFIDHVLGYEGGQFLEMQTDGLIANSIVLGIGMIIPVFVVWELVLLKDRRKGKI